MGKKTYFEDTASLALLYNFEATSRMMLSYKAIEEYDKVINENLDIMKSDVSYIYNIDDLKLIYFYSKDENDKEYLILKPNIKIEEIRHFYIGSLPLDIIVASQKENALNVIGLKLIDGNFVKRKMDDTLIKNEECEGPVLKKIKK